MNGRRSMPTICVSVWSRRASAFPRLPAMPVMATSRGIPGKVTVSAAREREAMPGSPEDVLASANAFVEEPLDGALDCAHLLLQRRVLVVGRTREAHRLTEVDVVTRGEGQGERGGCDR